MLFPYKNNIGISSDLWNYNLVDTFNVSEENIKKVISYNKRFCNEYYFPIVLAYNNTQPPFLLSSDKGDREFKFNIPDFVRKDVENGVCKIVLDYSLEGYTDIDWDFLLSSLGGIQEKDILFLTSVYNHEVTVKNTNIKSEYQNFWEVNLFNSWQLGSTFSQFDEDSDYQKFRKQIKRIENKAPREFHFTSYNRRPREHRIALLTELYKEQLLQNNIYSWGGNFEYDFNIDQFSMHVNRMYYKSDFQDDNYKLIKYLTEKQEHRVDFSINPAWDHGWKDVYSTCFTVVSETYANSDATFLSEKSFKPFANGQPFVMWGDVGTVQALREHGYDVFDKWINHSYDSIKDKKERLDAVIKEVRRLSDISKSDWVDTLFDMKDAMLANNENFHKCYLRRIETKYLLNYLLDK